ncbi:MAG: PE-PPE domain-containing protein [Mycobacterium sp.]
MASSSFLLAPTAIAAPPGGGACGTVGCTNGATALLVGGEGSYAQLTEEQMTTAFGGYFANYDARISVPFPGDAEFARSIPEGSDNLYNAIYAHQAALGTPITIGGVSKGAPSVVDVLYRLMEDLEDTEDGVTPPLPEEMTVAIYGAPSRVFFVGVKYQPVPDTPWDVVVVSAEYDGTADFPDNPFNILAVLNAVNGAKLRHVDAAFYDIQTLPTRYKVEENSLGGTRTTIIIPAERLPLLHDMYESDFWDPNFVAFLDRMLKPMIDSAYNRNWSTRQKGWIDGIAPLPAPPAGPVVTPPVDLAGSDLAGANVTGSSVGGPNPEGPGTSPAGEPGGGPTPPAAAPPAGDTEPLADKRKLDRFDPTEELDLTDELDGEELDGGELTDDLQEQEEQQQEQQGDDGEPPADNGGDDAGDDDAGGNDTGDNDTGGNDTGGNDTGGNES